jgi:hypothetical protein
MTSNLLEFNRDDRALIRVFIDILRFLAFPTRINREDAKARRKTRRIQFRIFLLRVFLRAFAPSRPRGAFDFGCGAGHAEEYVRTGVQIPVSLFEISCFVIPAPSLPAHFPNFCIFPFTGHRRYYQQRFAACLSVGIRQIQKLIGSITAGAQGSSV